MSLLSFPRLQMRILDKFPIEGGQKDPKKRIIPFLPGDKHRAQHHSDMNQDGTRKRKSFIHFHEQQMFVSTPTDSIALPTTFHCFINCHAPPRPNLFEVCNSIGRLAGRDLSNLINSLWARAEESSQEILCLTSHTAQVWPLLFWSLWKPNMGWTVFPYKQQTTCTISLFCGLFVMISRPSLTSYKVRIERGEELLVTAALITLWIRAPFWVLLCCCSLYY